MNSTETDRNPGASGESGGRRNIGGRDRSLAAAPDATARNRFYLSRKLIGMVALFVVLASGLVVLVNFSINMISASRNYTALISQWNQFHSQGSLYMERYARSGDENELARYRQAEEFEETIARVVEELFREDPDPELVFHTFNAAELYPNEISTLLMAFRYFGDFRSVRRLRESWDQLAQLDEREERLIEELVTYRSSDAAGLPPAAAGEEPEGGRNERFLVRLDEINEQWVWQSRQLTAEVAGISQGLRQYGLWFSVINGILLLLIGVVISVRVSKSLNRWELTLKERDRLARIPEMNSNPVLVVNLRGEVSYCNTAAEVLFPKIADEGLEHPFISHLADHLARPEALDLSSTHVAEVEGTYYQQLIHYVSEEEAFHIHAQDITEKRLQQREIRKSLHEKDVLLAEIHHRVKNNLAVVSGLLELESMMGRKPDTALKESRDRIKSMAIIHEILYKSSSFSQINLRHYVEELADYIGATYIGDRQGEIRIRKEVEDVEVNINQAIPAGLILNELLVNAVEHAYGPGESGEIRLQLRESADRIYLAVADDGGGMPEDFDVETRESVGYTIIRELLKQLDAGVTVEGDGGYTFTMHFRREEVRGSGGSNLSALPKSNH